MTRIACVGITVQDRLYYLATLPDGGGKYVAHDYREIGGGPAATAAVAAARLGAQVDFIGRVGDDATGNALLAELESYGVNTRLSRRYANARSSQSAILVDGQGERIIINHPSPDLPDDAQWLMEIDFSLYDVVLADVRWHQGVLTAFTLARQAGVTTLLDADVTPQDIRPLVALADHAAFSEPGLQRMTGENDTDMALLSATNDTNGHVYVTRGQKGCYWLEDGQQQHQPGFKVDVVDTTGAGDVFHGALAVALGQKSTIALAVRYANAVAALKCTRPGGRAGIPDCDQTDSFLTHFV
ncbi:sugar kinase [Yersinia frederiksenii]|uniref:sugar kinase n=1 Tax=Yersinia frederiksenii TaxID=29484 RepID=UPI0005E67EF0|nr:sugar kinase [Yersinia frederiksenii]MDN0120328.1 sugar kinase [Yersinia frederiksenii]CNF09522.1 ribokinase [Yersinia frederiksenii]